MGSELMLNEWCNSTLGELFNITSSKRIFASDYCKSGVPFYRSKEIIEKAKGQKISTELFISNEKYNSIKNKYGVPQSNDILLTSVGTIGVSYIVRKNEEFYFKDGNLTWLQTSKVNISPNFINLWLQSDIAKKAIDEVTIGSTQQALTISALKSLKIKLPPLPEQKAIAHILGTLDDKIELNRKLNETLEAMAQALFKSWFVDFDPVIDNALAAGNPIPDELKARADIRANLGDKRKPLPVDIQNLFPAEFQHTEQLGWIPKGWEIDSLGNTAEIFNGFAFKSKDYTPSGLFLLRTKNFSDAGFVEHLTDDVFLPHSFLSSYQSYLCEEYDFFLVMVGASLGKVSMLYSNCLPAFRNQNMWCFRPKNDFPSRFYINHLVQKIVSQNSQIASGSARDFYRKEDFKKFKFIKPNFLALRCYEDFALSFYKKVSANHLLIDYLTKTREILLPKLLSGKIRIPDVEKFMEERT